ncbi:type IV pilin [Natronorarus salvus]|uniref:type IV pilin n=1 Tax=Natronorarus salvus TaxID=3117733 RepID=UPI002F25F8CF
MTRAIAPVVGSVLLLLCVLGLATTVAVVSTGFSSGLSAPGSHVSVSLSVDAETNRFVFTHDGGERLDPRTLTLVVAVDGTPLDHQPPVPFFSAEGFHSAPTGVFNEASTREWTVGGSASFVVAGSNSPTPDRGSTVTVELYEDGRPIARAETTAR